MINHDMQLYDKRDLC